MTTESPPEMLTFFLGGQTFSSHRFLFRIGSHGFTARKPTTQQSNPKSSKIPEVSRIWSKPSFCNRSFPASICQASTHGQRRHGFHCRFVHRQQVAHCGLRNGLRSFRHVLPAPSAVHHLGHLGFAFKIAENYQRMNGKLEVEVEVGFFV